MPNPEEIKTVKSPEGVDNSIPQKEIENVDDLDRPDTSKQVWAILENPEAIKENLDAAKKTNDAEKTLQEIEKQNPSQVYPPVIEEFKGALEQRDHLTKEALTSRDSEKTEWASISVDPKGNEKKEEKNS